MDNLQEIWQKSNNEIINDDTINEEFIRNSISEDSLSITSILLKTIRFGIMLIPISILGFIYNLFFYVNNSLMFFTIVGLTILSAAILKYLVIQSSKLKQLDVVNSDLLTVVVEKLNFLNRPFQKVLHFISYSVIAATFVINLTIENSDGIFELRKILILSIFYIFVYLLFKYLLAALHSVYHKQLSNALYNLERNTFKRIDEDIRDHNRNKKTILIITIAVLLLGVLGLLLTLVN